MRFSSCGACVPKVGRPEGCPPVGVAARARARGAHHGGDQGGDGRRLEGTDMTRDSRWRRIHNFRDDQGMATTEYALVTVAAAAFAGVLIVLVRSEEVRELLAGILRSAFG